MQCTSFAVVVITHSWPWSGCAASYLARNGLSSFKTSSVDWKRGQLKSTPIFPFIKPIQLSCHGGRRTGTIGRSVGRTGRQHPFCNSVILTFLPCSLLNLPSSARVAISLRIRTATATVLCREDLKVNTHSRALFCLGFSFFFSICAS